MRPQSLAEVADLSIAGESFDRCLWNFLDEYYASPSFERLKEPPQSLRSTAEGNVKDAYLAATAEELARKFGLPQPAWTFDEKRKLHRPWFAISMHSLRALLLHESPAGFRSRNLFVSANALSRA